MVTKYGTARKIAETFFTRTPPDSHVYVCKCGVSRKWTGTSYSNLVSHVKTAHPEYQKVLNPDGALCQSEMTNFLRIDKSRKHTWVARPYCLRTFSIFNCGKSSISVSCETWLSIDPYHYV